MYVPCENNVSALRMPASLENNDTTVLAGCARRYSMIPKIPILVHFGI
jgi:hypothetical protein